MAVGVRDEAKQKNMSEQHKPFRQPSHTIKTLYIRMDIDTTEYL